jgi:hypothetical protein
MQTFSVVPNLYGCRPKVRRTRPRQFKSMPALCQCLSANKTFESGSRALLPIVRCPLLAHLRLGATGNACPLWQVDLKTNWRRLRGGLRPTSAREGEGRCHMVQSAEPAQKIRRNPPLWRLRNEDHRYDRGACQLDELTSPKNKTRSHQRARTVSRESHKPPRPLRSTQERPAIAVKSLNRGQCAMGSTPTPRADLPSRLTIGVGPKLKAALLSRTATDKQVNGWRLR